MVTLGVSVIRATPPVALERATHGTTRFHLSAVSRFLARLIYYRWSGTEIYNEFERATGHNIEMYMPIRYIVVAVKAELHTTESAR